MAAGGLIYGGLSLLAAWLSSRASDNASQAQIDAANRALDFQEQIYQRQYNTQLPWLTTGGAAVRSLGALMGLAPGTGYLPDPNPPFRTGTLNFPNAVPPYKNPTPNSQPTGDNGVPRNSFPPPVPPGTPPAPPPDVTTPPDAAAIPGRVSATPFVMPPGLENVGTGANAPPQGGGFSVRDPNGGVHTFGTQIEAYSFSKQAGLL